MAQKKDCLYKESPSMLVRLMALNQYHLYKRSPSMLVFRYSRGYHFNATKLPLLGALFWLSPLFFMVMPLLQGASLFAGAPYLFLGFILFAPISFFYLYAAWLRFRICLQGRLYLFDAQSAQISLNGSPLLRFQDVYRVLVKRNPGFDYDSYPVGLSLCNGGWVELVTETDLVEAQKIAHGIGNFMGIRHEKAWR
jgi:hypothetical protein